MIRSTFLHVVVILCSVSSPSSLTASIPAEVKDDLTSDYADEIILENQLPDNTSEVIINYLSIGEFVCYQVR